MALSLGDVTLYFRAETSDLHGAIHEIGTRLPAELQKSNKTIEDLNANLDATGDNVAYAGEAARKAGKDLEDAGNHAGTAFHRAQGELALFGEITGIQLPRHVRSFIAALPGVTTALSAAFSATAVFFIIAAIVKAVEKIQEWREEAHKTQLAWDAFNTALLNSSAGIKEKLLQTGIQIDELSGKHLAALQKQLELINQQSMKDLTNEFQKVAGAADAMFKMLEGHWYLLDSGSKGAKNALVEFKTQYDLLLAEGKKKEAGDLLAGTLQSAKDALAVMQATKKAADEVQAKMAQAGRGIRPFPVTAPTDKELQSQKVLIDLLQHQVDVEKDLGQIQKNNQVIAEAGAGRKIATKQYEERAAAAQRAMEAELSDIANVLAKDKLAFETRGISAAQWAVAQQRATDAVTAAEEKYARKVAEIAQKYGTRDQAAAASAALAKKLTDDQTKWMQDQANAQEVLNKKTDAYNKAVMAIVVTWGELLDKNVSKAWDEATQATERLIRAQERLARTRAEADQVQAGISFDQQERAIIQFADLAIGATENMNRELLALEIQRRDSALAIQQDEIDRLTKKRDDYQEKLLTMEEAPGLFSEAEVIATRAHLDEANAELEAGLSTRDQIREQHDARYFAIEESMLRRAGQSWRGYFELIASGERRVGLLLQLFGKNVAQGIGEAVKAAVMGSATFSEAMAQMGKAALAELAGLAVVEALKEGAKAARDIAEGFSMLANPFTAYLAPGFFLAGAKHLGVAALWGALGAGAAVGGSAIGGKEGGSAAGGGTVTPFQSPQQVEQQPVQTQNVFRLGSGALISKRTVTMLGDDIGGGDAREAVVPLDNPRVMQDIAEAFARAGGGGTTIHIKVEGMISTDNMHQFITQLNRDVNSGKYRVTASNSRRLTKGSL